MMGLFVQLKIVSHWTAVCNQDQHIDRCRHDASGKWTVQANLRTAEYLGCLAQMREISRKLRVQHGPDYTGSTKGGT